MTEFIAGILIPDKCESCPVVCDAKTHIGQAKAIASSMKGLATHFFDTSPDTAVVLSGYAMQIGEDETTAEMVAETGVGEISKQLGDEWETAETRVTDATSALRDLVANCAGSLALRGRTDSREVMVRLCRSPLIANPETQHQSAHVTWSE